MSVRASYTAVVERNVDWVGQFVTEPYEAAWASEAIFFVRALAAEGQTGEVSAQVQISPDGMRWCNEGTLIQLPAQPDDLAFCKVTHFGNWLRLAGELPLQAKLTVIVYIVLKE